MTSLVDLRWRIQHEAPYIGIKPYSRNIVRLTLAEIAKDFGRSEANQAVKDFRLVPKGFNEEPEE